MPLTFPSNLIPNQVTWHLEPNTAVFVSPLSRSAQTLELPGARWVCDMTLPPMKQAEWRPYSAWLAKMRGQAGRVYFSPPHYRGSTAPVWAPNPSAITADSTLVTADSTVVLVNQTDELPWGTPTIRGSGQAGTSLRTAGWIGSVQVLSAGDYISYDTSRGRSLHMVVEDAVSESNGRATLVIEPPIRTAPIAGAPLETEQPTAIMALQDSMTGATTFTPHLRAAVSLRLVEVF